MYLTLFAWLSLSLALVAQTQPAVPQQPTQTNFTSAKGFVLEEGTPVRLRINRTVSSADSHVGDTVDFEVLDDISVNGTLVIPKGGLASATVTEAQAKRRMARGGKLDINIDYVKLVTGEKAALRAVRVVNGGGHTGAMVGGIVATSLVFFPAAPFFLFMHGKDISIPKGTEITAYVNGDMKLDIAKFQPAAPANAPAQSAAATSARENNVPRSTDEETAEISSDPSGADIEIDNNFVGNTPSSVGIAAGQHTLRVSKKGYKSWERTLRSSTGNIKITAVLEPIAIDAAGTAHIAAEVATTSTKPDPAPRATPPATPPANSLEGMAAEARIGILVTGNPTARHDGVEISGVQHNGPADSIGIQPGDVILAIDGHYLYTIDELRAELLRRESGTRLRIQYRRDRIVSENSLTLGKPE
jgi:hypothetical protein